MRESRYIAAKVISFDMDGTLVGSEFTDWVWKHGIPTLYADKVGLPLERAKEFVHREYQKIGEHAVEWYDVKYWLRFFDLDKDWRFLLETYADRISVYPDVRSILEHLKDRFLLALTSNAGREFIEVELRETGLEKYFDRIFSVTSDFGEVKKTATAYQRICQILQVDPVEVVHVGDHYEFDYLVPHGVGIRAFFLDRSAQRKGDSVIWTLTELGRRLEGYPKGWSTENRPCK